MTDPRLRSSKPIDDEMPVDDIREIQGDARPEDQDAVLMTDELEHEREPTLTELDRGDPAPDRSWVEDDSANLDGLDLDDLREGETDDPDVATEEGLTYVPPVDPPLRADREEDDGIVIAAGAAVSAESEPYDDDHRSSDLPAESELIARIRAALRADAATTELADRLVIGVRGSTVVVRGVVDGIDESDTIVEVIDRVDGVNEIVDQTDLAPV